jgi:diaminopimelate decarboxylase
MSEFFAYHDGELCAEELPLSHVAARLGTPVYVYSLAALEDGYRRLERALRAAMPELEIGIHYAMKANSNQAVIAAFARLGAGADVVSGGELKRALAAGVAGRDIVFSGVGKTAAELEYALATGCGQINVESEPELELLATLAQQAETEIDIAIRVNPDVDPQTHAKISTGRKETKFGIDIARAGAVYERARALAGVRPVAIAVHIGSQLTDLTPFAATFRRLAELVGELRAAGHDIRRLDLGGGIGISYGTEETAPDFVEYAAIVRDTVGDLGCALMFEPGRALTGNAGVLLAEVIYVKEGADRRFVIVDAAMNDLIRPTLYEAHHPVHAVRPRDGAHRPGEVVGPVCETGDFLTRERDLPPFAAGDLLVLGAAGAYSAVMSSTYNTRALVPEVLVSGARMHVIRRRLETDALLALDSVPDWLDDEPTTDDEDTG